MKKCLVIVKILLCCVSGFSQNVIWNKVNFIHEQNKFFASSIVCIDNFNKKYVLSFNSNIEYGDIEKSILLLTKYDEDDSILWSKTIAETNDITFKPTGFNLVLDGRNNVYLSFNTKGSVLVKEEKYKNISIILRLDREGEILNLMTLGGACEDHLQDIAIDKTGNLYIGGVFGMGPYASVDCNFIVRNDTLTPKDRWGDMFLVKLNKNFEVIWTKTGGTRSFDSIGQIEVFEDEVYFTGTTRGSEFIFDSLFVTIPYQVIDRAGFIAKTDTMGNINWLKYLGLKNVDFVSSGIYSLNILNKNSICLAFGGFTNGSNINELIIQSGPTLFGSSSSTQDYFLISYNGKGDVNWAKSSHNDGDVYVLSISEYKNNSLLVSGYFGNNLEFNDNTNLSQGGNDIFVACYNANGEEEWIKTAGGKGNDTANSIALDQAGRIYVSGGTSSHPVTFGDITKSPPHPNNVFLARLSDDPILSILPINNNQTATAVYPNPATNRLWLQQNAGQQNIVSLLLYNIKGNLVQQNFKNTNNGSDVSQLSTGVYLLNITYSNGAQEVVKWCKQ